MNRKDLVLQAISDLYGSNGISASEVADYLGLERANVSKDLNRLAEKNLIIKKYGKPVLFYPVEMESKKGDSDYMESMEATDIELANNKNKSISSIDKFQKQNESLFQIVEQAKAAVLYPPFGMNMLLLGESGVGKSMFAQLIYKYAKEINRLNDDAEFIDFNCADYANNPQLLLGTLFGVKKGAYTGAIEDSEGLISKANRGILFLDEVHRLPPEGQEMFFKLMDNGEYRRLGEVQSTRKAQVLIICATTESPDTALLKTFMRRIPMVLTIPSIALRSFEERYNLITTFFNEEAHKLQKDIKISLNVARALLNCPCPNNIGELKVNIQLLCAKAYADFISKKNDEITIRTVDLPNNIKEGLYSNSNRSYIWNKLRLDNGGDIIFSSKKSIMKYINESIKFQQDIYETINLRYEEMRRSNTSELIIEEEIDNDINKYFSKYKDEQSNIKQNKLQNIVEPYILQVINEVIEFCQKELNYELSNNIKTGLIIHIDNTIKRVKRGQNIINPKLSFIKEKNTLEFKVALNSLDILKRKLDIVIPEDEAGFLTMFIKKDGLLLDKKSQLVNIFVITHGEGIATAMVKTVNRLLESNHPIAFDVPLEENPKETLIKIEDILKNNTSDSLFLVDMGSTTTFGDDLERKYGIRIKTIPLVSTLHVIEATRKAMLGATLDEIYNDVLRVNVIMENSIVKDNERKKLAIITVCTTGQGSALTVKYLLHKELKVDESQVNIIPLNISGNNYIYKTIDDLENKYKIIAIISSFKFEIGIPQFGFNDIFMNNSMKVIQKLIDTNLMYLNIGSTLKKQYTNVDGIELTKDIQLLNENLEEKLNVRCSAEKLIGLTLHLGGLINGLITNDRSIKYDDKEYILKNYEKEVHIVKSVLTVLENKYEVNIPEDEICYIVDIIKEINT